MDTSVVENFGKYEKSRIYSILTKEAKKIQQRKENLFNLKWCWENWSTTCKRTKLSNNIVVVVV